MGGGSQVSKKRIAAILSEQGAPLFSLASAPMKQVGRSRYYHLISSGLERLSEALAKPLATICDTRVSPHDLVAKVADDRSLSVLVYPNFYSMPHPELAASVRFTGEENPVAIRRYRENPPILHRKELLLGPRHEHYNSAHAFTLAEKAAGLLDPPFDFGFKQQWERRLESMGYEIRGYELKRRRFQNINLIE